LPSAFLSSGRSRSPSAIEALAGEERLSPAGHLDHVEEVSFGDRVVLDEGLGFGAIVGVDVPPSYTL
jgi:hypothetical protein